MRKKEMDAGGDEFPLLNGGFLRTGEQRRDAI
jgi:hypothetical protein